VSRTVVQVFAEHKPTTFYLGAPPDQYVDWDSPRPLGCKPTDKLFTQFAGGDLSSDLVKQVGKQLFKRLAKHQAVGMALDQLVLNNNVQRSSLYIRVAGDDAESLPWETLCSPKGDFLALDHRWPMGRMADPPSGNQSPIERAFEPPLRILAVLSAPPIDARPEWDALYSAIRDERLKLHLEVYVCQLDLKVHIESLGDPRIHVNLVPNKASDLLDEIQAFRPHLLHFFCHGSTQSQPRLVFGNIAGWLTQESNLTITADDLRQRPEIVQMVWLLTLNCCDGAAVGKNVASIAWSLVKGNGFPAVIGMREPVASADANLFTEAGYLAILAEINRCVGPSPDPPDIEWASILYQPRRKLAETHADGHPTTAAAAAETRQWTLPVIYVRPQIFRLRPPSTETGLTDKQRRELQVELNKLLEGREFFKRLPDVPPDMIEELNRRIDSLEHQLYPDGLAAATERDLPSRALRRGGRRR